MQTFSADVRSVFGVGQLDLMDRNFVKYNEFRLKDGHARAINPIACSERRNRALRGTGSGI